MTADLTNRTAKCLPNCLAGGKEVPSKPDLPFFVYQPDQPFDYYYCGCVGWD